MKFSVLLPTRNRLDLLKYAIESVRRQDYDNWEIIVSDNYSNEDVLGYVQSLNEFRIKYFRTDSFIPVTDNWNNALYKSSGDFVIMLGDDDCLLQGYFTTVFEMIEKYGMPDFIYSNALLYAYPGVMPGYPDGFLQPYSYAPFFVGANEPFWLAHEDAIELVKNAMNFKMVYTYNMQHSVLSRKFIDSLENKGLFFQSPYPDFYATNVIMMVAKKILICPQHLVTVGISPKSFGFYYSNAREEQGVAFLNNLPDAESAKKLSHIVLPGLQDKTSWLFAMELLRINYGKDYGISVNYRRYRYLQIIHVYFKYYKDLHRNALDVNKSLLLVKELRSQLSLLEKIIYPSVLWIAAKGMSLVPESIRNYSIRQIMYFLNKTPSLDTTINEKKYCNILEVFKDVNPKKKH